MINNGSNGIVSRRHILVGAASVAGLAALGPLVPRALSGIHLVLTDPRLPQSPLFRASIGDDVQHVALEADIGQQWYAGLRETVRGRTVAGLTSWIDYVVLSDCAREQGLRVVSSRSATPAGRIHLVSWLLAPRKDLQHS